MNDERRKISKSVLIVKAVSAFGNPAIPMIGTRGFASATCVVFAFVGGDLPPGGVGALRASPIS